MANNLDNINYKKLDPKMMLQFIENMPQICREAKKIVDQFALPSYYIKAKKFLLVGMGGSGSAGDVVFNLLSKSQIMVQSIHDYDIPGWVDSDTVVIACSYSGNTEETISAFIQAKEKGAKLISITTGGQLKMLSEKFSVPLIFFNFKCEPRAAFPFHFIFILSIFSKLGHYNFNDRDFENALAFVEKYMLKFKSSTKTSANIAKSLARNLFEHIPVIYSSGILKGVGTRLKTQINENSKHFAFCEEFPELNHNSLLGHLHPKNNIFVVSLESAFDYERVTKRQNITAQVLQKDKINFERIKFVPNESEVGEILAMVLFGDFVSYYLACLNQEDPSNMELIEDFKERLNK